VPEATTLDRPVTAPDRATSTRLHGTPAGGGITFGIARRVMRVGEAEALRPGEVLVAPALTPALLALLPIAGAIVVERPASLSAGLGRARELHVPTVVALPDATTRIATGDEVLVDGTSGAVTVVHHRRR
jgi:phosphohistidine swiveling domain-containing protein